jgi:hypothetical protein
MVDEMKKFFHQNISTLTDTYIRATGDEASAKKIKALMLEIKLTHMRKLSEPTH